MITNDEVQRALIDISPYDVDLGGPEAAQPAPLVRQIAQLLTGEPGWCIAHGTHKVLARHGLYLEADRERGYQLLESIFRGALALIDFQRYAVTPRPMTFAKMDVDGFNLNQAFSHDGKIEGRAFMTAKCIHFDAATPFVANVYGPNRNIRDGFPLICDVRRYCRERGVPARRTVENIPNNYNIVIKNEYYEELRRDYSVALDLNLESDIIIVMLLNEIDFGIAHGATDPRPRVAGEPSRRPIRHFEYQYSEESHYEEWYSHYSLDMAPAKDYRGENLALDYHQPPPTPFSNIVRVDN